MAKLLGRRVLDHDREVEAEMRSARREHHEALVSKNNVLREFLDFEARLSAPKR